MTPEPNRYAKGVGDALALLCPLLCAFGDGRVAVASVSVMDNGDFATKRDLDVCDEHRNAHAGLGPGRAHIILHPDL